MNTGAGWVVVVLLTLFGSHALACMPDDETLCLLDGRFQVDVDWKDAAGNPKTLSSATQTGSGKAHTLSNDTGTFWLFGDQQHEVLVKILNGCPFNNSYWLFAAIATNVEYTLTVTDTEVGAVKQYFNPLFNDSAAIVDTAAFDTCATATTTTASPVSPPQPIVFDAGEAGTCISDANTLCLFSNRFAVQVDWTVSESNTGSGTAVSLTNESGYFWFFSEDNIELIFNTYDGRGVNGNFWYFFSVTNNVEYEVRVTDTITNETQVYANPLGSFPPATLDTGDPNCSGVAASLKDDTILAFENIVCIGTTSLAVQNVRVENGGFLTLDSPSIALNPMIGFEQGSVVSFVSGSIPPLAISAATFSTDRYTIPEGSGNLLPDDTTDWLCVTDQVTDLIWWIKNDDWCSTQGENGDGGIK